jgi:hypothetical protein
MMGGRVHPEIYAEFKGVISMFPDPSRRMVQLRLLGVDDRTYLLDLPGGILATLILGLMGQAKALATTTADQTAANQPMNLTTGRLFQMDDGQPGLELTIEDTLQVPLMFPKDAIPKLRKALDALEGMMKTQPPAGRPN